MSLTPAQIKHFRTRLDQIRSELYNKNTKMTFEEKKEAFEKGEYTVEIDSKYGGHFSIVFPKEKELIKENSDRQITINKEYNSILDRLYLPSDDSNLLELLEGFRKLGT